MCGIYGAIIPEGKSFDAFFAMHLLRLASLSQSRGRDAFGYMVSDGGGKHEVQRFIGDVCTFLSKPKRVRSAMKVVMGNRMFLGHTRQKTVGTELENKNNHPFVTKNFIMAHNGHITNHDVVREKLPIPKGDPDTDSFVLLALMERIKSREPETSIPDVIAASADCLVGGGAFWLWDKRAKQLYLFRDGNPLYTVRVGDAFVFSSEREIIEQTFRGLTHVPLSLDTGKVWAVDMAAIDAEKPSTQILRQVGPFGFHHNYRQSVDPAARLQGRGGYGYAPANNEWDNWEPVREHIYGYGGQVAVHEARGSRTGPDPYWLAEVFARDEGQTFSVFQYVTQCLGLEIEVNDPEEKVKLNFPAEMPVAARNALALSGLPDGKTARTLEEFDKMAKKAFTIWRANNA